MRSLLAAHVVQIHAGRQSAAHHLEVAHFADMRLHRCLEHIKTKRSVAVGLHFFAVGIDRCRHILDKRHHVSKEFHHAPHTHVFHGAHAENRIDRPIHQSLTDTFAHFILGKMALIKELLHQGLIVLGRSPSTSCWCSSPRMLHLILRNIGNNRYTTVGSPFIFLHQQHINHRVKAGTTCQRILNGDNLLPNTSRICSSTFS